MEKFLNDFEVKFSIPKEIMSLVSNIILNDNIAYKKENFTKYVKIVHSLKYKGDIITPTILLLFSLDIHREFKNELTTQMKSQIKNINGIVEAFLNKINFDFLSSKDIPTLRNKALILNNIFSYIKKQLNDSKDDRVITLFFLKYVSLFQNEEIAFLISNLNDEIISILIFLFNCVSNLISMIQVKEHYDKLKLIKEKVLNEMIHKSELIEYSKRTKDFHFTLSSLYFYIIGIENDNNKDNYEKEALILLKEISKKKLYEILFIYLKGYYNNFYSGTNVDIFQEIKKQKINLLNEFIREKINNELIAKDSSALLSFYDFYIIFLKNDLKGKYALLINDIMLIILTKGQNQIKEDKKCDLNNEIIKLLFIKIKREKELYSFIEDNYFCIISTLFKFKEFKNVISLEVENYFSSSIVDTNYKPLINECQLFSFLDSKNSEIFVKFLKFIFSFDFEKKDIQLLSEYSRIFFDFSKKNSDKVFISNFPEVFLKYILRMDVKNLKFLNNFLITLEKNNTEYYLLLINECYNKILGIDKNKMYAILLTFLKPFRTQKRTLFIDEKEKKICLKNDKFKVNISISLDELKKISITNNEFLTLLILEFINEFDNFNIIFPIIMSVIKYNIKTANLEFKSGSMKSIKVYFDCFIDKIAKTISKGKKEKIDLNFVKLSTQNILILIKYLCDNIYDRPYENLISYLEIINFIIEYIEQYLSKCKNKDIISDFMNEIANEIYNKGMCYSLISLLRHSWYFVRYNAFKLLKRNEYKKVIMELHDKVLFSIGQSAYSLRQMDAEGSAYLLVLLLHHGNSNQIAEVMKTVFDIDYKSVHDPIIDVITSLNEKINQKEKEYMVCLSEKKSEIDIKEKSIHSLFIFVKVIIELNKEKLLSKEYLSLLFKLAENILGLNIQFNTFLINNGVSEFALGDEDGFDSGDNEDKLLISLWCTSKYSLSSLSLIYDIFTMNYATISSSFGLEFESKFLQPLSTTLDSIITLITTSKHMGVVKGMNESLFKICLLLNKSSEEFKQYRLIPEQKLSTFISSKVQQEEISSTLRRSAGIPFLIVSLIKSYISPSFSSKFINDLLSQTIDALLDNFNKHQEAHVDSAVHCLHILRVICDDTLIKPYIRPFYTEIILKIIDGLQSENWSIKNACMLMFSRVIKNNFYCNLEDVRNLQTFKEYFVGKKKFYDIVCDILQKNADGYDLSDCLLLFITFFTKFKTTKPSEYSSEDVNKIIEMLFNFDKKNNKLFRKLLSCAVWKLSGNNFNKIYEIYQRKINEMISQNDKAANNKGDFYYNIANEMIKVKDKEIVNDDIKKSVILLYKKLVIEMNNKIKDVQNTNYLLNTKYLQLIKKMPIEEGNPDEIYNYQLIGIEHSKKTIDLFTLLERLNKNSRKFYYFKFIKHSLCYFLNNGYIFTYKKEQNLIEAFKVLKYEELFVFLFKKFSSKIDIELLSLDSIHLNDYSVNISSRIAMYISKNISLLSPQTKNYLLFQSIEIMSKYPQKSKVINKLFPLLTLLLPISSPNSENINQITSLIFTYANASNIDKLRINSLFALNDIISYLVKADMNNDQKIDHLIILKIFFFLLNDEYQGIRMKASDIFMKYNVKYQIVKSIKIDEFNLNDLCSFTNEYILKKLLMCKERNELFEKFYEFVMENNFYHMKNNSETKVFYYEPDNRYIDNIESKLFIVKNYFKNGKSITLKEASDDIETIKIFCSLENLTNSVMANIKSLIREIESIGNKEEKKTNVKYLYKEKIRNIIYSK